MKVATPDGSALLSEIVFANWLASDLSLHTVERYHTNRTNRMTGWTMHLLCNELGIPSIRGCRGEQLFDPDMLQVKAVWGVGQVVVAMITTIPVPFVYTSYLKSLAYMTLILSYGIWNGVSYYMEVFSKQCNLKFVGDSIKTVHPGIQEKSKSAAEELTVTDQSFDSRDGC